jgi:hypothetical protein
LDPQRAPSRIFRRHDAAGQTKYQELKQLARSQHRVLAGTPGTLKQRTQSGKRYWVREYIRVDGSKVDEYLGPESSFDKARLAALRAEIELARALAAGSAKLRLFGYQRIDRKPAAVLEVFFNRGLSRAGLTLVGSHAYGALLNELGVLAPRYKTEDVEIIQALAVGLPGGVTFRQLAEEPSLPFAPALGMPSLKELAAYAQAVPFLDFLIKEPIDSVVLSPNQIIPIKLPSPERFLIHKLFSSQSRRTDRDKVRKDLEQAAVLAAALEKEMPGRLGEAFRRMPPAGRDKVKRGARAAAKNLEAVHPEGEEALLKLAGRRG